MVKNDLFNVVMTAAFAEGGYISPSVKIVNFRPEGVLCSSVYNEHQGFDFDEAEDL